MVLVSVGDAQSQPQSHTFADGYVVVVPQIGILLMPIIMHGLRIPEYIPTVSGTQGTSAL